jgi:hypothetical protein
MAHTVEKTNSRPGQAIALLGMIVALILFGLTSGEPRNASLEVRVSPSGASVRLLEPSAAPGAPAEQVAEAGAVLFDKLVGGKAARVVVTAKGFKDGVGTAQLPIDGGRTVITVHLTEDTGQILVETDPPGGSIFVDNAPQGKAPQALSLAPGTYTISARRSGFAPAEEKVTIGADESKKILLVQEPIGGEDADGGPAVVEDEEKPPEGYGFVLIKSSHTSTFMVDNQIAGTGMSMKRVVRAGPHLIGCRAHNKGMDTRRIEVVDQETIIVEFEFEDDTIARAKSATDPSTALYWHVRAGSTRNSGRYGDAVDMFKKALEIDPDYYPAHRQLGYTLPALKRWDEAIEHWENYLELNPHAADKEKVESLILQVQRIQDAEAKGEEWQMRDILNDPSVGFR